MNLRRIRVQLAVWTLAVMVSACAASTGAVRGDGEILPSDSGQDSVGVDLEKERADFEARVEADEDDWLAWNALGTVYFRLGDLQKAETALLRAQKLKPEEPGVLASLGMLRHRQKRNTEARVLLEKALALNPGHGPAHNNLGLVLVALKEKDAARSAFEAALAANPNDLVALENLGLFLHYHLGDAKGAKRYLEHRIRVLQRGQYEITADDYREVAMAALFSDDPDSAITYLEEATKLEPTRNELFFHLGMAHFAVREVETSRQILQRVHDNEPDVALYAGMLGRVLVKMRRFEEALSPLERSAAIDPEDPDVFMAIGYSRERLGQKEAATAAYARSCSLGYREACSPGQAPPGK